MAITYGVIGTNYITDSWILAAQRAGEWQLHAVYSRTREQAQTFGDKHHCSRLYTSLDELAADEGMQAVYIASPNSLHYTHAQQMLRAKKHVILEKPAVSTVAELDDLFRTAKEEGVYLIEAYRHIQEANFKRLRTLLVEERRLGAIYGASLQYASYSSRWDNVLAGETPNVFSPAFAGGSLVDVGVYPVTFAVALFGAPHAQTYVAHRGRTGVDAAGFGLLQYDGFGVQINTAKCYRSTAPCEIYGERGTITCDATTDLRSLRLWDPKTKKEEELAGPYRSVEKPNVNMEEEAAEFARIILRRDADALAELEQISRVVLRVTANMRAQAGIVYPADKS